MPKNKPEGDSFPDWNEEWVDIKKREQSDREEVSK